MIHPGLISSISSHPPSPFTVRQDIWGYCLSNKHFRTFHLSASPPVVLMPLAAFSYPPTSPPFFRVQFKYHFFQDSSFLSLAWFRCVFVLLLCMFHMPPSQSFQTGHICGDFFSPTPSLAYLRGSKIVEGRRSFLFDFVPPVLADVSYTSTLSEWGLHFLWGPLPFGPLSIEYTSSPFTTFSSQNKLTDMLRVLLWVINPGLGKAPEVLAKSPFPQDCTGNHLHTQLWPFVQIAKELWNWCF